MTLGDSPPIDMKLFFCFGIFFLEFSTRNIKLQFSLNYVIFTWKKISLVKQGRISQSYDRWEYCIVPEVISAELLIAKQVSQIHGNALQAFVSIFPVPNTMFQDLCFSCKDLSELCGFIGFLSLSCGGRALSCCVLWKWVPKTHLISRQWVGPWGWALPRHTSWELMVL